MDLFDFLRNVNFGIHALCVFVIMVLMDIAYAFYTVSASKKDALPASIWASGIVLCSSIGTIAWVQDPRLVVPAILGAFVGTYCALRFVK